MPFNLGGPELVMKAGGAGASNADTGGRGGRRPGSQPRAADVMGHWSAATPAERGGS